MARIPPPAPTFKCANCGHSGFEQLQGKLDTRMGWGWIRLYLYVCQRCRFVMPFHAG